MRKRVVLIAVGSGLVALSWVVSGQLSGRGLGFRDDHCEITAGRGLDGVMEGQARCTWDIPADRVEGLLARWEDQEQHFGNVIESTVLDRQGDQILVRQIFRARGIADREVIMECFSEEIPGGRRYHWHKARDQSRSTGQNTEVELHEGSWEVVRGEHDTVVTYRMRHLPGGSVPSFLVSMFLSSGMRDVLADLRRAAEASHVAAQDPEV